MVRTGLDRLIAWLGGEPPPADAREAVALLRGGRVGLVTNAAAVTRDLVSAADALTAAGLVPGALFGPEHGVRGDLPDGAKVPDAVDPRTGARVWSLYGDHHRPTGEMLAGLDALVFDIPDVGARFYTFASTLSHVMAAAAEARLPVVILDRPNPLGGVAVEGPVLEPAYASFVGLHPIPIRHGATMGELGRMWSRFGAGDPPTVVACEGWRRAMRWEETGLAWAPPSPNMPSAETALVYPGMCLLEGTNVSEGRGTALPFLQFGAPWVDAEALAAALNGEGPQGALPGAGGLPGVGFRATRFRPTASKHAGELCAGCQVHVLDRDAFRPVATGVAVLAALRRLWPERFAWLGEGREIRGIDRLAGTRAVRDAVDAGRAWHAVAATWAEGERQHRALLHEVELYA